MSEDWIPLDRDPRFVLCVGGHNDGIRITMPPHGHIIFKLPDAHIKYVYDGKVMRYQGECDDHGNLLERGESAR